VKGAKKMTEYYSKVLVSSITKTETELKITLKAVEGYSKGKDILWAAEKNIDQIATFKVLKVEDIIAKVKFEALLLHAYSNQNPVELCLSEVDSSLKEVRSVTLA